MDKLKISFFLLLVSIGLNAFVPPPRLSARLVRQSPLGYEVHLKWTRPKHSGVWNLRRRNGEKWKTLRKGLEGASTYVDRSVKRGQSYEYVLMRSIPSFSDPMVTIGIP